MNFDLLKAAELYETDKRNNLADPINCKKYVTDHIYPMRKGQYIVFEDDMPVSYDYAEVNRTYFMK